MPALPYAAVIQSPVGKLGISVSDVGISKIDFLEDSASLITARIALAKTVADQLQAYFIKPQAFNLPLDINGTAFQLNVWHALQQLKKPITYGELASKLNTSARAIGGACRTNPVPIIIPCHRILAADNKLGGFNGATQGTWPKIKQWLLKHEGFISSLPC